MSTPLIVLAAILAIVAFILIPLVFMNTGRKKNAVQHDQTNQKKKHPLKNKKR